MNIGELIDALHGLREDRRALEEQIKPITKLSEEYTNQLIHLLQEQGTPKSTSSKASVSIGEALMPNVTDWDVFYEFVKENDALYMLERRVATTAYREMRNLTGEEIPGVTPYNKVTLSLRSI